MIYFPIPPAFRAPIARRLQKLSWGLPADDCLEAVNDIEALFVEEDMVTMSLDMVKQLTYVARDWNSLYGDVSARAKVNPLTITAFLREVEDL